MQRRSEAAGRMQRRSESGAMQKTVDGVRLAYDDAGNGQVIVLLHGFPLDRTIWDAVFAGLIPFARVIRIDLRGSGESAPGLGPALMETLAGDVFGLLEALGVERAIVAGHSMGGYVALAFFRMYAERVAGLALIASHVGADSPNRAIERDAQAARVRSEGAGSLGNSTVAAGLTPAFAAREPAVAERLRAIVSRQAAAGAAAQIIGIKERVDSSDLLEDIAVPALIVAGEADPLIAVDSLERTAAAVADCEFVVLADAAHLPMLEAPAPTIAALQRLLARCAVNGRADPQNARATRA